MVGKNTTQLGARSEAYEMFQQEGRSLNVSYENDRLNEIRQNESSGISIRAVKSGKIGFSYSSKMDEFDFVADSAIRLAPYGKPYDYKFADKAAARGEAPVNPACGELSVEQIVETGNRLRDMIKQAHPEALAECSIGGGIGRTRIVTSGGQESIEDSSSFGYYVGVKIAEEGNFLFAYRGRSSSQPIAESEMMQNAREACDEFAAARKTLPFKSGSYPVLLTPSALSDILMPIEVSVNGINIAKKTSSFVDAMGKQLFDKRLTITDDPFHAEGPSGTTFDGEGVPASKRAIIDAGVLKGFVHTLSTAQKSGHTPTGNAQRSVSSLPMPGWHNMIMDAGTDDLAEMYRRAEGGLCIRQMLGTFTSNFLAGQVSGNISLGFAVHEGRNAGRVKNCALNVNAFELLKDRILAISSKREWAGGAYLPYVLVDAVSISARD